MSKAGAIPGRKDSCPECECVPLRATAHGVGSGFAAGRDAAWTVIGSAVAQS